MGLRVFEISRQLLAPPSLSYINLSTIFAETAAETSARTFIEEATADKNSLRYKVLLESEDIPYDVTTNTLRTLRTRFNENFFEHVSTYAFGTVFNKSV
ncbi:hypothetical protein MTO96_040508 [Rhipicephalus appendiculatus]